MKKLAGKLMVVAAAAALLTGCNYFDDNKEYATLIVKGKVYDYLDQRMGPLTRYYKECEVEVDLYRPDPKNIDEYKGTYEFTCERDETIKQIDPFTLMALSAKGLKEIPTVHRGGEVQEVLIRSLDSENKDIVKLSNPTNIK